MKKIALLSLIGGAALLMACSGDNNQNDGGSDSSTKDQSTNDVQQQPDTGTDGGNPTPPTLKTQVDRIGRPAINTALNHVFDPTSNAGTAKDAYNADKNVSTWPTTYKAEFRNNLAIFDGLDRVCGNQAAYALANSYVPLATLASDDRIYLDTSHATCTTYLAVELNATGIQANTDCGGRKLTYDVIDATYAAVSGAAGASDGISADATKTGGTAFPYLAPAQ